MCFSVAARSKEGGWRSSTRCQVKKGHVQAGLHVTMSQGLQQSQVRDSSMSRYLGLVHPGLSSGPAGAGCRYQGVHLSSKASTDAFELWCWKRLLRVPWTTGRSNQSILKEISPECSLEGLMLKLKLKLQYFGHLM